MLDLIILFLGALGIGFVSAIVGIGGGTLMIPFMVLVLNYDVKEAIATSLVSIIVTSSSASSIYLRRRDVDLKTAFLLEPPTAAGAIVGAFLTISLPTRIVEIVFSLLLLYVSLSMLIDAFKRKRIDAKNHMVSKQRKGLGVLIAFLAGLTSGMLGIGGGVLKVPLMTIVLGLPIRTAIATSSFMVGLTASAGSLVYLLKGYVNPYAVAALALGIIPGATLGAHMLKKISPRILKIIFSVILMYASIRLLI
ncbi:sulfite exporter TauE/SafE family protein [Staphylothermus hellenicus]|uniref:Probable membrane transporter protein n=1 Tax=Staphylothermus hellenicus (strain DSM 12710 / JCM 10830 / BK20S6-10-b1 / P8) TaxID=591019 RepID=D7DBI0_STAHD|nr:sulfite exporter TauE/SafE family protein [Staphylothermus hellenicus]ADI31527.1 protein of unknown function DUF81 [Staphylothermus hellenicus DSM 12710]